MSKKKKTIQVELLIPTIQVDASVQYIRSEIQTTDGSGNFPPDLPDDGIFDDSFNLVFN